MYLWCREMKEVRGRRTHASLAAFLGTLHCEIRYNNNQHKPLVFDLNQTNQPNQL